MSRVATPSCSTLKPKQREIARETYATWTLANYSLKWKNSFYSFAGHTSFMTKWQLLRYRIGRFNLFLQKTGFMHLRRKESLLNKETSKSDNISYTKYNKFSLFHFTSSSFLISISNFCLAKCLSICLYISLFLYFFKHQPKY